MDIRKCDSVFSSGWQAGRRKRFSFFVKCHFHSGVFVSCESADRMLIMAAGAPRVASCVVMFETSRGIR